MKSSRRLNAKKYKDDQKVKNSTMQNHDIQQIKIEDQEPEEQVKKTQIDDFLENIEPLSSIPNSKHRGYMAFCSLKCCIVSFSFSTRNSRKNC